MTEEKIKEQVQELGETFWPNLLVAERHGFDVRPAVNHDDIEIFLNGRIWPISSEHFEKIHHADKVEDFVLGILPRLRGHRYNENSQQYHYTYPMVLKEVNAVLLNILNDKLESEDGPKLLKKLHHGLKEKGVKKTIDQLKEFTSQELFIFNAVLATEIGIMMGKA